MTTIPFAIKRFAAVLLALTGTISVQAVAAETYPSRPVRLIVPFAAGGGADLVARVIGKGLSERLGQQAVIDNRAGAGGSWSGRSWSGDAWSGRSWSVGSWQ